MIGFSFMLFILLLSPVGAADSLCFPPQGNCDVKEFKQRASRFWEYEEQSKGWVEIKLPLDLISCSNGSCNSVGSINGKGGDRVGDEDFLPLRKRASLTRMSEASVWVTGQSGSIYERFWNGARWVIGPHELPVSAGRAVSVFIVNQTILALY